MRHIYFIPLLCAALLLPSSVCAQDEPQNGPDVTEELRIDGTDLLSDDGVQSPLDCVKSGSVAYDADTRTLTLSNAILDAASEYIIDSSVEGLTIILEGANTIMSGYLRLSGDTEIAGTTGSSLICTGTTCIIARAHDLTIRRTFLQLSAGQNPAIDNRNGHLTIDNADVVVQSGSPAIYTSDATLTDCTADGSAPGTITFDAEAGTFKFKGSVMSAINIQAQDHRENPNLNLFPAEDKYSAYAGFESSFTMPTVGTSGLWDGTLTYASSDPDIVSISSDGIPTFHKPGEAVITVTASATNQYAAASLCFVIAYEKLTPTLRFSATTVTVPYTTTAYNQLPTLTYSGDGKLTFVSSDSEVLYVDVLNGVHVMGVGTATITVTSAETDTYSSATASYTCTVTPAPEQKPSEIHWTNFSGNALTVMVGEERNYFSNYPVAEAVVGYDSSISYYSSNPNCVYVDPRFGGLTFLRPGTAVITATAPETDYFFSSSISYTVYYVEPDPDPVQLAMQFPAPAYTVQEGQEDYFVSPKLYLSHEAYDGTITYASSNPDCIRVDAQTGQVTFIALGTATITATASTTDLYFGTTASYDLTYEEAPDLRPVPELAFTEDEAEVAFMSDGTVKVPILVLRYSGDAPLSFSSDNTGVVSTGNGEEMYVTGEEGVATVTVTSAENDRWKTAETTITIRVAHTTVVGVKGLAGQDASAPAYDLSGKRLKQTPRRGIYITAGRVRTAQQ